MIMTSSKVETMLKPKPCPKLFLKQSTYRFDREQHE